MSHSQNSKTEYTRKFKNWMSLAFKDGMDTREVLFATHASIYIFYKIDLIMNICCDQSALMQINNLKTTEISTERDVRQGWLHLSPILFNLDSQIIFKRTFGTATKEYQSEMK